MKVTIITVTYNSSETLQKCISSVANQSFSNIEHIIVDGASKDDTLEIIKKNSSVSKFISEKDDGLYHAMNKGISISSGDIIGFLNSDDIYINNTVIEEVVEKIGKKSSLYADLCYVKKDDLDKVTRLWKSGDFKSNNFNFGWMPPHPTFFVKKNIYKKYGLFNLNFKSSADYELMLRFLYKEKISTVYLPKVIIKMREGGKSNKFLKNRILANIEDKKAWTINGLQTPLFFSFLKPIRKIPQFFKKNINE